MREQLQRLTLEDVNRAIRQYLKSDSMRVVLITKDADALRDAIVKNSPSPIKYNSPKPDEIMSEDKLIEVYKVSVRPEGVRVVPVAQVFE